MNEASTGSALRQDIISEAYIRYHHSITSYIGCMVGNMNDAEDMSQDVFMRLLDYKQLLSVCTIRSFLYTITRNMIVDYYRDSYRKKNYNAYVMKHEGNLTEDMESSILYADILAMENKLVDSLPSQRRKIYIMSRYENKSISNIASELRLSERTVENHLRLGRKDIRTYLRKCILI